MLLIQMNKIFGKLENSQWLGMCQGVIEYACA